MCSWQRFATPYDAFRSRRTSAKYERVPTHVSRQLLQHSYTDMRPVRFDTRVSLAWWHRRHGATFNFPRPSSRAIPARSTFLTTTIYIFFLNDCFEPKDVGRKAATSTHKTRTPKKITRSRSQYNKWIPDKILSLSYRKQRKVFFVVVVHIAIHISPHQRTSINAAGRSAGLLWKTRLHRSDFEATNFNFRYATGLCSCAISQLCHLTSLSFLMTCRF